MRLKSSTFINFADVEHLKQSFEPLADNDARILILGSIPGDRSIELGEYYGHPQNRFWKMIAVITGAPPPINYGQKRAMLMQNRIALWDVAQRAHRQGSMDSAIRNEEPNDIAAFIAGQKKLQRVVFNGKKAEQLYGRYIERLSGICYLSMPSTSPANAAVSFDILCEKWREILI